MGRSTTIKFVGLGLVALSFGLVACASDDSGSNSGGSGGLVSGDGGGTATGGGTSTGGGTATGGGTSTGGGSNVTIECTGSGFSIENGYVDTGTLCGYGWTATFSTGRETIDPPCGSGTCFEGATELCADATIGQGDPWVSAAEPGVHTGIVLGFGVAEGKEAGKGTYTTSGTGLTVNYSFNASGGTPSGQRIVISSGTSEYCAEGTSGVAIPWGSFQRECWEGGAQTPFTAGSPIDKVSVQILGSYEADVTVTDFCITGATVN